MIKTRITYIHQYYIDEHAKLPTLCKRELLAILSAQIGHLEEHQPGHTNQDVNFLS